MADWASADCARFLASPRSRAKRSMRVEKIIAETWAPQILCHFLFISATANPRSFISGNHIAVLQQVLRRRQGIAEAEISSAWN